MTKKKRQGAGAEFALRHAEESNDVSHAMSLHELKSLYYLKKEIKEQQRRIAELETLAINCQQKLQDYQQARASQIKLETMRRK